MVLTDGGDTDRPPGVSEDQSLREFILDRMDPGIYLQDISGLVRHVNSSALEMLGHRAEDLVGQDAHDRLHRASDGGPLARSACSLLEAFLSRKTRVLTEEYFARADGTVLPVTCLTTPYLPDGEGAAVIFLPTEQLSEQSDADGPLSDLGARLSLVAESTTVLTSSLELDKALEGLVSLIVPRLADYAVIDLLGDDGEVRRAAAVRYHDGAFVDMEEFLGPLPPVSEQSRMPLSRVLRGGSATLVSQADYVVEPDSELTRVQQEFFRSSAMHSAVIAPMRALGGGRGRIVGALTVGRADQKRPFGSRDLALVDDLARRAGLAVDNAQLYEGQRRIAENMQRHLLPPMPEAPGLEAVARYEPAQHASNVGGDWYDAFELPDNALAVVIGDVVGHDLTAAAHMSQVRNMLRAFAWTDQSSPAAAVDRLDRALGHISDAPMATLVMARLDGGGDEPWQLRWTNAGHPPPLVVLPDGRTRLLEQASGVLLGTDVPIEREDAVVPLPPESTLVLYTDGLVEGRSDSLEDGLLRLCAHASWLAERPLDEFCDRLIELTRPTDNNDDIALIALRPHSVGRAGPQERMHRPGRH